MDQRYRRATGQSLALLVPLVIIFVAHLAFTTPRAPRASRSLTNNIRRKSTQCEGGLEGGTYWSRNYRWISGFHESIAFPTPSMLRFRLRFRFNRHIPQRNDPRCAARSRHQNTDVQGEMVGVYEILSVGTCADAEVLPTTQKAGPR